MDRREYESDEAYSEAMEAAKPDGSFIVEVRRVEDHQK
jgi:hypothetical protein